jgi:beta-lactamase class C
MAQSQALATEIDSLANRVVEKTQIPGLAIAVVSNGQVIMEKGFGVRRAGGKDAIDAQTVFRLASVSKTFAAAAVAQLVDQGYVSLDDPLSLWLPEFRLGNEAASAQATVRDLLSHRLGLPFHALDKKLEADSSYEMLKAQLPEVQMRCPVGQCYAYQNVAFNFASDLVFAVRGQYYPDWIVQAIARPLRLAHFSYGLNALLSEGNRADPHIYKAARWQSIALKPNYYELEAAAGANASVQDLRMWMQALMGDRADVLSAASLQQMTTPQISTLGEMSGSRWRRSRVQDASYGLGLRLYDYAGSRIVFHAGAVEGYRAMIGFVPNLRSGVVILWNSNSNVPAGLFPTVMDRLLNLPKTDWLELDKPVWHKRAAAPTRLAKAKHKWKSAAHPARKLTAKRSPK